MDRNRLAPGKDFPSGNIAGDELFPKFEEGSGGQVLTNVGAATPGKSIYMDLRSNLSTSVEQGLLGLAFHPQFQSNGYFYIYRSWAPGTGLVYERLSRFQANPPSAPVTLASTELVLFDQQDDAAHHGPPGTLMVVGLTGWNGLLDKFGSPSNFGGVPIILALGYFGKLLGEGNGLTPCAIARRLTRPLSGDPLPCARVIY